MDYFPLFFKLDSIDTLVIGGGNIALSKVELLLKSRAKLTVVAKKILPELKKILTENSGTFFEREYAVSDFESTKFLIVATDNNQLNEIIYQQARARNILVNVVDTKEKCDFIFPALVERGDLTVAISTSGVAPTVASWLRSKLEIYLPNKWANILDLLKKEQATIREKLPDTKMRRRFYRHLIDKFIPKYLHAIKPFSMQQSTAEINQELQDYTQWQSVTSDIRQSKVYLLGAGSGESDLITLKAQQVLQQADVVLYDRLIAKETLEYIRRDARKIYVGKENAHQHKKQPEINQMLIDEAKKGNIVVRLKGGDPFIFGRGGEEIKALKKANIDFEVVSGISAVQGIAANLNIPLTLRGVADKLLITSIYRQQNHKVNWQQLALPKQTLALYMGLSNLTYIVENLLKNGIQPQTPIALIEKGTWREQKIHYSTMDRVNIEPLPELSSPVMILIGEVINHRVE